MAKPSRNGPIAIKPVDGCGELNVLLTSIVRRSIKFKLSDYPHHLFPAPSALRPCQAADASSHFWLDSS